MNKTLFLLVGLVIFGACSSVSQNQTVANFEILSETNFAQQKEFSFQIKASSVADQAPEVLFWADNYTGLLRYGQLPVSREQFMNRDNSAIKVYLRSPDGTETLLSPSELNLCEPREPCDPLPGGRGCDFSCEHQLVRGVEYVLTSQQIAEPGAYRLYAKNTPANITIVPTRFELVASE